MTTLTSSTNAAAGDFTVQRPIPDNLVPDLNGVNAFDQDKAAADAIGRYAPWARSRASALGAKVWDPAVLRMARDAQRFTPELRTLDRFGNEIYSVEFHPAYHDLMRLGFGSGVHSLAWTATEPGGHSARAALSYLWNQIDGSTACPTGMAYSANPILRSQPELAPFAEAVAREAYDPSDVPMQRKLSGHGQLLHDRETRRFGPTGQRHGRPASRKARAGRGVPRQRARWFASAPMADGYLTVAQTAGGVSCLFLPRRLPDGSLNNIKINRLKDKLGNKANASSEIEYHDAHAVLVGEEGKGIRTILSAAEYTRLDFSVGSAGLMRAALSQALHYNDYRTAFGAPLARLPMQAPVLADLVLEWAGATHLRWAQGGIVQTSVEGPADEGAHRREPRRGQSDVD